MMKPVRSIKNQYRGVNAHLHSFWQAKHKWNRFHNVHIGDLMKLMQQQLTPMGYIAEAEESLQIRRIGDDVAHKPVADVLISDTDYQRASYEGGAKLASPQTISLEELIEEDLEHPYSAVAIYSDFLASESGEPVAWVELLSPTNKGETEDAKTYRAKRRLMLEKGLVFVEMDYLHETPPTFRLLADYTRSIPDSHPYRILVLDPRPDFKEGQWGLGEFSVDEPIPILTIPLNGDDKIEFDFGAAYRKTFEESVYGFQMDYSQFPLNFERYSETDRTRIANRMLAILKAARDGVDLEKNVPLAVEEVPLETALQRISEFVGA
jgi:Protein of unknown function (DUF4058)